MPTKSDKPECPRATGGCGSSQTEVSLRLDDGSPYLWKCRSCEAIFHAPRPIKPKAEDDFDPMDYIYGGVPCGYSG